MNEQLFIPKKCKVGFNLRKDTYTGKLGYVIAQDGKKWRKEVSWENWRQKKGQKIYGGSDYIDGKWVSQPDKKAGDEVNPVEFDNVPTSGFVLNKKVGGYKSDWNMRQTYARVYDPRGFEFEINVPNLLYILQHSNCMRGKGLEGEFIYSWDGKDLVLLPAECPEFQTGMSFTNLQTKKISARDLVPGISYKTKKEEDVIYIGRYMWYETEWYKNKGRTGKKYHIFHRNVPKKERGWKKSFFTKGDASFLAEKNSETPVDNFAELVDEFKTLRESSDIVKFKLIPTKVDLTISKGGRYDSIIKNYYFREDGEWVVQYEIGVYDEDRYYLRRHEEPKVVRFTCCESRRFNAKTKEIKVYVNPNEDRRGFYSSRRNSSGAYSREQIENMSFFDLQTVYENGKRIKVMDMRNI